MPPGAHWGARIEPWRALPVFFCLYGLRPPPSGSKLSTSALPSSSPQAAPSAWERTHCASASPRSRGICSATFEPEPTDTNIRLPSGEKRRSRVECPPSLPTSTGMIVRGKPCAAVSPLR